MVKEEQGKYFIKNYALDHMASYSNYPQSLLKAMLVRTLIGPHGAIAEQDLWVSAFQLDPGTVYDPLRTNIPRSTSSSPGRRSVSGVTRPSRRSPERSPTARPTCPTRCA